MLIGASAESGVQRVPSVDVVATIINNLLTEPVQTLTT